ncbi:MAG: 4'-phosphopantetheinyl transferase superfamily protein [Candidatus Binatia bacterium]|nr:4'-phosphopantetheinyl transferase superfamily protein [Candidatus Binatia bacterium]
MIEKLLPPAASSAEAFDDSKDVALFPEEERALGQAVEKRRREFTTARMCARRALKQLGLPPSPIVPGPRREPRWPTGIVGIDAEPNRPLPDGVFADIADDEERRASAGYGALNRQVCWDRLLFCAKESVYKAWFPLTMQWLGFEDVSIDIDPVAGTFSATLNLPAPSFGAQSLAEFEGRWMADRGLILTAITRPTGNSIG